MPATRPTRSAKTRDAQPQRHFMRAIPHSSRTRLGVTCLLASCGTLLCLTETARAQSASPNAPAQTEKPQTPDAQTTEPLTTDTPAATNEPLPPPEELQQLIGRLGSDSFQRREQATSRLLRIGANCLPALRKQAEVGDLETRQRVDMIIKRLMADAFEARVKAFLKQEPNASLPGWDYARQKLDDSRFFRQLFVDLSRQRPAYVQLLDGSPQDRTDALNQLTSDLVSAKRTLAYNPNKEDCIAMLLVATDPEVQTTEANDVEIFSLMRRFEMANAMQDAELARVIKDLIAQWLPRISPNRLIDGLILGMELEMDAITLDIAARILQQPNQDPILLQFGFKAIARFGGPKDALLVRPFLDDKRPGGGTRFQVNETGKPRRVLIGDLAMATVAITNNRGLREIGFPAGEENARWGFDENSVGFPIGEEGDRARARVRELIDELLNAAAKP